MLLCEEKEKKRKKKREQTALEKCQKETCWLVCGQQQVTTAI